MRYNWDAFVSTHPEKHILRSLSKHHHDAEIYSGNKSFTQEGSLTQCKKSQEVRIQNYPTTIVFQPGSWDATMWPQQQFIKNPRGRKSSCDLFVVGPRMLVAFSYDSCGFSKCRTQPRIVGLCFSTRFARNNYAISTMNTCFEHELSRIKYPDLRVVRAYDIILPKAGEFVCNNHYLCHLDIGRDIWQTAPDLAVLGQISNQIC